MVETRNIDERVAKDFGREWSQYDQSDVPERDLSDQFNAYFAIFPWAHLPEKAKGFDLGCGSGRWARMVSPRVGELHCIEPSEDAMRVAKRNLSACENCRFHANSVDEIPLADASMDFGYSLGVLHHVPDTLGGIESCVKKLKPGAPLLLYLYYSLDNKPAWFRSIWIASDVIRRALSVMPYSVKLMASRLIAALIYFPLARGSRMLERMGVSVDDFPLSAYRDKSFYTMRTDALDRFGTRLEQRFSRQEIKEMMSAAGLVQISFSDNPPYWCAVGYKDAN
jgi:SAM-dependent methyltransferase